MFVTMLVGLYTSRIVLQTLGIEDFGIYNIVGGVVVLFTFINSAMTISTQRYLSYELGKSDGDMSTIYSLCFNIHISIAVVLFIFAETIGLWFVNQLNIPIHRMVAANWVYQFSVLSCLAGIIRVPDNASIIAYERMSFFGYMGILEALMKLLIIYVLLVVSIDKLILYSILTFFVTMLLNVFYWFYRKYYLSSIKRISITDKAKYKELLSFSGWTMFGSIANVGLQQGINIIINLFYGVTFNAAVGIANQVNSHVTTFVQGFQQALNPQLTKSESEGDKDRQFSLICSSAKFSFFIMLLVAFPIMINLEYILTLWLGKYPSYTIPICRLIIIAALIGSFSNPLWVTIFATGKIKAYQALTGTLLLLNVPIAYIGGCFGMNPVMMYVIRIVIDAICLIVRLIFLRRLISFDVMTFIRKVLIQALLVATLLCCPLLFFRKEIMEAHTISSLFIVSCVIIIYEFIVISLAGLSSRERIQILVIIKNIKNKFTR